MAGVGTEARRWQADGHTLHANGMGRTPFAEQGCSAELGALGSEHAHGTHACQAWRGAWGTASTPLGTHTPVVTLAHASPGDEDGGRAPEHTHGNTAQVKSSAGSSRASGW
jgi:hypothetical protein